MAATLTINAVPKQTAGVSFEVDATLQVAPSYQFHDDTGTFVALPAGASAPAASIPMTFTHPGLSAGTHTIALRDSVTGAAGSTSVVVTAPAPPPTGHATKYSPGQSVTTPDGHRLGLDTAGNMTWDGALIPGGGGTSFIAEDPTVGGATGTNYGEDAGTGNWWTWDTINGWVLIAPGTPNFGTTPPPPPPVAGPGHGPALSTHMTNPQTVTPISDGASGPWGNVTATPCRRRILAGRRDQLRSERDCLELDCSIAACVTTGEFGSVLSVHAPGGQAKPRGPTIMCSMPIE